MSKSPIALAGSVLLILIGAAITVWTFVVLFDPYIEFDRHLLPFILMVGLVCITAGTMQLVQRRRKP